MKRLALVLAVLAALVGCDKGGMTLQPPEGTIVDTEIVTVTGELPAEAVPGGTVVVNDVTGTFTGSHTWTADIPVSPVGYVTVVEATYTEPDGGRYVQRSALINGPKIDDGEFSPDGVGMRFTNTGLAGLGPVINDLAGSSFDISGLILAQDPLIPPTDAGAGVTITGKAGESAVVELPRPLPGRSFGWEGLPGRLVVLGVGIGQVEQRVTLEGLGILQDRAGRPDKIGMVDDVRRAFGMRHQARVEALRLATERKDGTAQITKATGYVRVSEAKPVETFDGLPTEKNTAPAGDLPF